MRLRVLGSSSSVPRPGRACSCYLLRSRGTVALFDLGTGAFSNLRSALDYSQVDAVVVSHMHADHFLDVDPAAIRAYVRTAAARKPAAAVASAGRVADAARPLRGFRFRGDGRDFLDGVFALAEYDPSKPLEINDLRLTFAPAAALRQRLRDSCRLRIVQPDVFGRHGAVRSRRRARARQRAVSVRGHPRPRDGRGRARSLVRAVKPARWRARAGVHRLVLTHYGGRAHPRTARSRQSAFAGAGSRSGADGLEIAV